MLHTSGRTEKARAAKPQGVWQGEGRGRGYSLARTGERRKKANDLRPSEDQANWKLKGIKKIAD